MKRYFCLISCLFIALFSIPSGSLRAEEIVAVDLQRVLSEATVAKALKNDLDTQKKKLEAALALKSSELQALQSDIERQRSLLTAAALEEKTKGLDRKSKEFQRATQDSSEELQRRMGQGIEAIVGQARKIATDLAQKEKYSLVVERDPRTLLYLNPQRDITDKVIEELNQKKGKS